MAKVIVKVVNGKPTITTEGFSGDACVRATENLERLLSGEGGVEVRDMTGQLVKEKQTETN
jgi:hypothetical protein